MSDPEWSLILFFFALRGRPAFFLIAWIGEIIAQSAIEFALLATSAFGVLLGFFFHFALSLGEGVLVSCDGDSPKRRVPQKD